ncbi:MAG: amidohydrolase family protein [Pseudomonadota bacterium]
MSNNQQIDPPSVSSPRAASLGRRGAILGAIGMAAGMAAPAAFAAPAAGAADAPAATPAAAGNPRRVDVHHHYVPPRYRSALVAAGQAKPSGMPGIPQWSIEASLGMMDRNGIETAIISVVNGVHFGDDAAARELSRHVNEEGAAVVSSNPRRFGLFATLPLPDVDGALKEIAHSLDVLKADGFIMSSNYRGIYLGDARFEPVFAELNRRKATVFLHPFDPHCPCCQVPGEMPAPGYPLPMLEFMFETTRTVFNMVLSGTMDKFPNVKFIVPHAGATVPVLAERVSAVASLLKLGQPQDADHFRRTLRGLYYDLAGWPEPVAMGALLQVADPAHIVYGSDWPYTPEPLGAGLARILDQSRQLTPAMQKAFMRDNALALFPRLGQR